jgi:hypothetical protein
MTKKCRNFFRTLDKIQEAAERGTSPILLGE